MILIDIKNIKPGDVLTLDGFVMATNYGTLTWHSKEMPGYITIAPASITVTVPEDFNVVVEAVKAIDEEINQLKDEQVARLRPYLARREELLKIGYSGQEILDAEKP